MRFKLYALVLFVSVSLSAQAQSIFEKWPALNQYHEVMAATFHPSEEGNLAPLKSRSGELKSKSARLAAAEVPAEFNSPMILSAIKELKKESKAIDKEVRKGKLTDQELTKSMAALHDVFHKIVGLCRDGH